MPVDNTTDFSVPLHLANSSFSPGLTCFRSRAGTYILVTLNMCHILLLPVFISVLYLVHRRRRRRCSTSTETTSPCDLFMYHSIIMQLNEFMGFILVSLGSYYNLTEMRLVGTTVLNTTFLGKALFHLLTCVERYLAVVHPITYLKLKQARGVRITNISIGCVWVLGFLTTPIIYKGSYRFTFIVLASFMSLLLVAITFCSISVLCALKRPGPGEVGGNRGRVDRSKQRAFYTIMAIMAVLLLRFGGGLIVNVLLDVSLMNDSCMRFLMIFLVGSPQYPGVTSAVSSPDWEITLLLALTDLLYET